MKKKLLILGTVSLAAVAAVGALSFKGTPSFVHATDNLSIQLTADNVKNLDGDATNGFEFDLVTTTTFGNEYKLEGVNLYATGDNHVYSKANPHSDGRLLDYVAGGFAMFQIPTQSFSNVYINSVSLVVSVDGGEKENVSWGLNVNDEKKTWLLYFDNAWSDAPEHNTLVIYEIDISYNCQIM